MGFAMNALNVLVTLFVLVIGLALLAALVLFVVDRAQRKDAIRRNYPVIGRFRHLFSSLGEFFPAVFLCHGPRGDAVQPGPARLG